MRKFLPVPAFLLFALCLLLGSLFPDKASGQASGSILGQVRVSSGRELPSPVLVTIRSHGAILYNTYTDNEGHFGVNGLPSGVFHIAISEDAYQPFEQEVRIDSVTSATMQIVNVFLVPKKIVKDTDTASAKGENVHLIDTTKLNQQVPKPARKEYEKGVKSDVAGKADDAIRHYARAVDLAPDYYQARNNLGSAYLTKSDFSHAQDQFERVIKENPTDASAYFNLANLYLLKSQYQPCEDWVEKGLRREPDSAFGHFLQGSLYARTGRSGDGESALRRSLELDPFMSKSHLALVNLYLQQKRSADAASELRLFLKNFPEDPFAPKAKQVLEKLEAGASK
jgi:Flp pilus assembly protein TadD